jgi:hypothetical protein
MEKLIQKHAATLAVKLRTAKKEKKWRGDGHGNLIENRAVEDTISSYFYQNRENILSIACLSPCNKCDIERIRILFSSIKAQAMKMAKAHSWTA